MQSLATQANIAIERLLDQRKDVLALAKNPNVEPSDRLAAHALAAELSAGVWRMHSECPAVQARRYEFSNSARLPQLMNKQHEEIFSAPVHILYRKDKEEEPQQEDDDES